MLENLFDTNGTFARLMNFLWNLILVSVLWLVCCLPVVTLGAASTAAYYTMAKAVRRHNGTVISEFFHSFRQNFKQATVLTLIYGAVLVFLLLDCSYFYNNQAPYSRELLYLFYAMICMVIVHMHYLFPALSRFTESNFRLFRMAIVMMFRHLLSSILLLVLFLAAVVGVIWVPWGVLLFPGILVCVHSFLTEKILRKFAPPPSEEDMDKWYYQ